MSSEIPVHPHGPRVCTCRYKNFGQFAEGVDPTNPSWHFVCTSQIDGEDGLCYPCRRSPDCIEQRDLRQREDARSRATTEEPV